MAFKNSLMHKGAKPFYQIRFGRLSLVALLTLLIPLGLTFYVWYTASQSAYEKTQNRFETLAVESEKNLINRLNAYSHALLGGAGFFQGSEFVSRAEWKNYVETIRIKDNFPGINGIGTINPVSPDEKDAFIADVRQDGAPDFIIHPETEGKPYYVITYIEPEENNKEAIGLNIAFEKNRMEAAEMARDTGNPAITKRIDLVQVDGITSGFLLLHPVYKPDMPVNTVDERRAALQNWVYAPFIANNFLKGLSDHQKGNMTLTIYDGKSVDESQIIYSNNRHSENHVSAHQVQKTLTVMQQEWTLVWKSTNAFEQKNHDNNLIFILVGGILFTGLLAVFLMATSVQRAETMALIGGERHLTVPIIIFLVAASGVFYLYQTLAERETAYIQNLVEEEAQKVEQLITYQTDARLLALKRMAQRWETAKGLPEEQWREDAKNYVTHIGGLKAVEWVDNTYHIRLVEPIKGNEAVLGMDILFDDVRELALKGAAEKDSITLTQPIDIVQGYKAFLAYAPIIIDDVFSGFIVAVFSAEEFFKSIMPPDMSGNYSLWVSYAGEPFFKHVIVDEMARDLAAEAKVQIYDKTWTIKITPTEKFIKSERSFLPMTLFMAGLLIAALLSLTVRYILISRLRSHYLQLSEETFREAMKNAPISMALLNVTGKWLNVNKSLCDFTGYSEEELLKTGYQKIAHPDDFDEDMMYIKNMLVGKKQSYHVEKRYIHKKGHIVWGTMNVSLARNRDGTPKYFILQIQDITERRKVDQMKSEFISIVSHELRTPLTSIRGSLGLIEGTMSKDLPAKVNNLISIAHQNCERLILLINDILDLDKITAGKMRFNMKHEILSRLIAQGMESNKPYGDKYNVKFELQNVPEDITVYVDADRWQQVFSNLLSNAAKFSPEGETVKIQVEQRDKKIRVSVIDNGEGIAQEFRSRIFGKFSQADSTSTRVKGGTGLGLNISKQIVEKMKGQIGFESEEGNGTVFWFDLPCKKLDDSRQTPSKTTKKKDDHRAKVLHVEDDVDFIRMLDAALYTKVNLVSALTFEEATQKLAEDNFSLVILDIGLPDESGLPLIDYIKGLKKQMPVIIVSADDPPEDIHEKVAAVLVKSRVSEKTIIDTVLSIVKSTEKPKP